MQVVEHKGELYKRFTTNRVVAGSNPAKHEISLALTAIDIFNLLIIGADIPQSVHYVEKSLRKFQDFSCLHIGLCKCSCGNWLYDLSSGHFSSLSSMVCILDTPA